LPLWLLHFLGIDNVSGAAYAWWSGAGSDISELAVVGAILGLLRKHNCAVRHCWRIGRHVVPGTDHACCARHAPGGAPTHDDVIADHLAGVTAHDAAESVPAAPADADLGRKLDTLHADLSDLSHTLRAVLLTQHEGRQP
jgi:hypothetical protein